LCNTATCRRFLKRHPLLGIFEAIRDRNYGRSLLAGKARECVSGVRWREDPWVDPCKSCRAIANTSSRAVECLAFDFPFPPGGFPGFRLQHTTDSSQLASHRRLTFWPAKWVQPLDLKDRESNLLSRSPRWSSKILPVPAHPHVRLVPPLEKNTSKS